MFWGNNGPTRIDALIIFDPTVIAMIEYNPENETKERLSGSSGICVVGIGGAGANVLDRIALENLVDTELISMNTDVRALSNAVSSKKLQLGADITRGLGAGGDPELGSEAAKSEEIAIREALTGKNIVFICVGLGGGTGSGAGPYVVNIAKDLGAFVVVLATMPFSFEGRRRIEQAKSALEEMEESSDALIVFENDKMGQLALSKSGVQEAFATADKIIGQSIRAVTTLVAQPGLIRIGMDDLMSVLRNNESRCLFGYGTAKGKNRSQEALKEALKSPLLDRGKMLEGASSVLVHITGGDSMTLYEVELLMNALKKHVNEGAHLLFGLATDENFGESLAVTLITSISNIEIPSVEDERPVLSDSGACEESLAENADERSEKDREREPESEGTEEVVSQGRQEARNEPQAEMDLLSLDPGQSERDQKLEMQSDSGEGSLEKPASAKKSKPSEVTPGSETKAGNDESSAAEIEGKPSKRKVKKEPETDRQGGMRLNLLPRVFGGGKHKQKEQQDTQGASKAKKDASESDLGIIEAEEKVDAAAKNTGKKKKAEEAPEVSTFVDRSRITSKTDASATEGPEAARGSSKSSAEKVNEHQAGTSERMTDESRFTEEENEITDQGALPLDGGKTGRFLKGEPTIVDGEDLDVPTFMRKKE